MATRTFGWVQNPGDLKKLKKVAGIFKPNSSENHWLVHERLPLLLNYKLISEEDYTLFRKQLTQTPIRIDYGMLKGKGSASKSRKDSLCTGIIQATIDAQKKMTYCDSVGNVTTMKKPYTDDWSADGYIRWAISCGLLKYVKEDDQCEITELGMRLAEAESDSAEESNILAEALLSYPPVLRVLSLLKEKDELTKFDLGGQLGFKGELGFTSIPQAVYLCDYGEAPTKEAKSLVQSNDEGDSDKYARGIASWLIQMGWVESSRKEVTESYRGREYTANLQTYSITRAGERALIKARGNSSNPRLPRVVMFEMLASNKTAGSDYLRYQRACMIKALSSGTKSAEQIQNALKNQGLEIDIDAIRDHIEGLRSIGLEIVDQNNKFKLLDKIVGLELPSNSTCVKDDVIKIKDRVRGKLKALDHKYLVLIDLAYSDASTRTKKNADAKEFEIQTAALFTKELNFKGMRLGDSGRPDVIISYGTKGTIIDNKSYKDGFSIDKGCSDEMGRYISENQQRLPGVPANEWWKNFDTCIAEYTFLFITSCLKGRFEHQLEYLSTTHDGIKGAAIGVESLLYLAEGIKSGKLTQKDFYDRFNNKEMMFDFL